CFYFCVPTATREWRRQLGRSANTGYRYPKPMMTLTTIAFTTMLLFLCAYGNTGMAKATGGIC
ncbi:hypothetical protein, partial [Brucella sp.]|uniref:hypothetical protein n=1 Tax=Brucella sp. TaxID=52132 RepID=UPI0028A07246